ncbi:MAG: hypothetical protein ACTS3F_08020 [Phycisphaerales bacterium]
MMITLVAAAGAASGLAGCSRSTAWKHPNDHTTAAQARLASVTIDPAESQGRYTVGHYRNEAEQNNLPAEWLAEAAERTSQNEARRAAAQVTVVRSEADRAEFLAHADATMHSGVRDFQVAQAQGERMNAIHNAQLGEMAAYASARERSYNAEAMRQGRLLDATLDEWESQLAALKAEAGNEWSAAQGEHTTMLAAREALAKRGQADIEKMTTIAALTEAQAVAKVQELRKNAQATDEQTAARLAEIDQQLRTTREQVQATVSTLNQQARSLQQSSGASVAELRARGQALQEQDVEQTFRLQVQAAHAAFESAKAEAEKMFQRARAMEEAALAEVSRLQADGERFGSQANADFTDAIDAVRAYVEHGKAEIAVKRVQAESVETQARAEFVKAEAEAIANALREQSEHQFKLAADQYAKIQAQAEAEAARVKSDYAKVLAKQTAKGQITFPGNTNPVTPGAKSNDPNPEFDGAASKPAVVAADRIAAFQSGLAQAAMLRVQADAMEQNLFATADERRNNFEAWLTQQQAKQTEMFAQAEAAERQSKTEAARLVVQSEKLLAEATADLDESLADAEASRRTSLAQITNLQAEADAIEKKAGAEFTSLRAQSEVAERNGESQIRSLVVIRDATAKRGTAQQQQLLAEADSIEQTQAAVVAQMRQEIQSARQILNSELARMDQTASSFIAIANAKHAESMALAENFSRIAAANAEEIRASNAAQQEIAQADVQFLRNLKGAQEMIANAAVAKVLANAEADMMQFAAEDSFRRVQIDAQSRIARASANEQFAVANADDFVTRALFDARIVQSDSDRNRAFAEQYLAGRQQAARTMQTLADSERFVERSNRAMARLNEKLRQFEQSAQDNWDQALAMPGPLPTPTANEALRMQTVQTLSNPTPNPNFTTSPTATIPNQIADVPTGDDN